MFFILEDHILIALCFHLVFMFGEPIFDYLMFFIFVFDLGRPHFDYTMIFALEVNILIALCFYFRGPKFNYPMIFIVEDSILTTLCLSSSFYLGRPHVDYPVFLFLFWSFILKAHILITL